LEFEAIHPWIGKYPMLSPTAAAIFHREMENERKRLRRDDPNYLAKFQRILGREAIFLHHQFGVQEARTTPILMGPVGLEDYGGDASSTPIPFDRTTARLKLTEWRSPADFRIVVQALHRRCTSHDFFNEPGLQFLRDGWILAEFAIRYRGVERVRIADRKEDWPDGYVSIEGQDKKIEATSVISRGRRLGDEYKFSKNRRPDSVEHWLARAEDLGGALEKVICQKVEKGYGSSVTLVVYLNISEYGIRLGQCRNAIHDVKQRYLGCFVDLHVLWKDELF
jgi:hypothetical protein